MWVSARVCASRLVFNKSPCWLKCVGEAQRGITGLPNRFPPMDGYALGMRQGQDNKGPIRRLVGWSVGLFFIFYCLEYALEVCARSMRQGMRRKLFASRYAPARQHDMRQGMRQCIFPLLSMVIFLWYAPHLCANVFFFFLARHL